MYPCCKNLDANPQASTGNFSRAVEAPDAVHADAKESADSEELVEGLDKASTELKNGDDD